MGKSTVVKFEGISKKYNNKVVLNDFSAEISEGAICGIIGPNGAGKTTMFRIASGLIRQTDGTLYLFNDNEHLGDSRAKISFMIEAPYLEPDMTAYQNLNVLRLICGISDKERINQVLDLVGLNDVGKKKVKNFSLGMRQRLGIAMALLKEPEVIVLDEPMNGLDPEGIVEMRNLLLQLNRKMKMTVIISSHLLTELYQLANEFIIIGDGNLIERITRQELEQKCQSYLLLNTSNNDEALKILGERLCINDYQVAKNGEIKLFHKVDSVSEISKVLVKADIDIFKIESAGDTLEDYYLKKVGNVDAQTN